MAKRTTKQTSTVPASRLPILLRAFQPRDTALTASAGDLDARHRVIAHLVQKTLTLGNAIAALDARLATVTDPAAHDEIAQALAEARGERDLCQARFQAINADLPFADPGPEAETELADAIGTIDRALADTAAIAALLDAVHGLVKAYAASATG